MLPSGRAEAWGRGEARRAICHLLPLVVQHFKNEMQGFTNETGACTRQGDALRGYLLILPG